MLNKNNNYIIFVRLLRIKQWVKNTFIFFPLLFSGQIFQSGLLFNSLRTFVGFCFISSGLYILNDYLDREKDRLHPKKADRPLAHMKIPVGQVQIMILVLLAVGLFIAREAGPMVLSTGLIYIFLHLVYNFYTKKIVILDVFFVAAGFHVRIWAGSLAIAVLPSVWLQMCVFLLALFLGFTKRRYEIASLKEKAADHRSVLEHYTAYLLDQIIIICSTLAIVFYGLYTISPEIAHRLGHGNMVYSIAFVIYGIFRYLYLVHVRKLGDDPGEALFSDKPLLISVLLWVMYVGYIIYLS